MAIFSKSPFTEIATLIRGVSYDKSLSSLTKKDGYTPILRANNIQKNLILDDLVYVPSSIVKEEQKIRKGDIVLAMSSGSKDLVGKSAQSYENLDAAFGTFCGLIRAKENIDSKFLGLYFQTQEYRNFVSYLSKGVNICNLKKKDIESLQIPLPPLATQRAIVTRIESLFAELDKGVEKLKTAQQQLKVYRQAVLNDCLTKDSEKWENVKLGEVTLKIGSGSTPKGGQTSYKVSGIPLVRSMNIYSDFIKYDGLAFIDESQAKLLDNVRVQEGDILLNITGASIGRVNIAPKEWNGARVNQHVCIIRMNSEYNSKFVQKYLASPMIQHWISTENYGETRQALSKTMIENIEIPNPPLLTQQRIVQEIETRLSACDEVEKNIAESLQQAEALRQSILKKAFSGELVASTSSATRKTVPEPVEGTVAEPVEGTNTKK